MKRYDLTDPPGVRFVPDNPTRTAALILAGSSGRVDVDRAALLARHGVVAESIQWFGGPGQHDGPWEVPLELFLARIQSLALDCDRVVLLGTSFGAEAALLVGGLSANVTAVVAFAPTDVVWSGVTASGDITSHWTLGGDPLPCVPFVADWVPDRDPPAFREFYRACRDRFPSETGAAEIPVERIQSLVLVAGGDDQVWPSTAHAEAIASRRQRHGKSTDVVIDPQAGHRTVLPGEAAVKGGTRMARGGTELADRRLGNAAWPRIASLLT